MSTFQIKITMEAHDALHDYWLGEDGSLQKRRKFAAQFGREEADARAEALPHRFYMVQIKQAVGITDDVTTLLRYVPEDQHEAFKKHVAAVVESAQGDIDWDFLGFMDDYEHIAGLVKARTHEPSDLGLWQERKYTIYDVGCAHAFQHVFFPMAERYVGIDAHPPRVDPKFFVGDCQFVLGRLPEVADLLEVDWETSIGIANMSLAYTAQPGDLETFDRLFKRKIIL